MIGKRSFANMESMTAIGWIKKKKNSYFFMKNKRMRQPCRMIVVYNKTHQTKKKNSFRYGKREKKKENDRPKMAARPRSINDRYEFVFFLAVRFLMDVT